MTATQNGRHSPQRNGAFGENGAPCKAPISGPGAEIGAQSSKSSNTARDRVRAFRATFGNAVGGFLLPKTDLLINPPGWPELTAYAYRGNWTSNPRSFIRGLGVIWLCTVGVFVIGKARIKEWLVHRPSRAIVFIAIGEMFLRGTGPGHVVADAIRGWFHFLAMIFLP